MKISTRLTGLFLLSALLCIAVGSISLVSAKRYVGLSNKAVSYTELKATLNAREADHLKWVGQVQDFFIMNLADLDVQIDDHKCALGRFLYGGSLEEIAGYDKELYSILESMNGSHGELHNSARTIKELWRKSHEDLGVILQGRLDDHRKWSADVANALLLNRQIEVETDPRKCAFGRWLISDYTSEVKKSWPYFAQKINEVSEHHNQLHSSVLEMRGKELSSERIAVFQNSTLPELSKVATIFQEIREAEGQNISARQGAMKIFRVSTMPLLASLQTILQRAISHVEKKSGYFVEGQVQQEKIFSRFIWASMLAGTALIMLLGKLLGTSITRSFNNVVEFAGKLSKGDLSSRLPMGREIDCSSIKKCRNSVCPSYGKKAYCWVESGSFSNNPTCPRAIKGEDCRTCNVYLECVRNEIEEMGSGLNAMADELKIKSGQVIGISEGDLCQNVHIASDEDQFGKSLFVMVEELNSVMQHIKHASQQITAGASQSASAAELLAEGASESSAALEEITASVKEMTGKLNANVNMANEITELSGATKDSASDGLDKMRQMLEAMDEMDKSSQKIAVVIKVIDDIAFQTNLLALNAAVEAARAGKHGKGFAVVAGEVKSLAVRCAKAAKETEKMISDSLAKSEQGTRYAGESSRKFDKIVGNITTTNNIIDEMNKVLMEQKENFAMINESLSQVDEVVQNNTAAAEEISGVAEEHAALAEKLTELLNRFSIKESYEVSMYLDRGL